MARVFLHLRASRASGEFKNEKQEFSRVPMVGEYVAVEWDNARYRVELVEHVPFAKDWDAEVYGVQAEDYWAEELGIRPSLPR